MKTTFPSGQIIFIDLSIYLPNYLSIWLTI